ncbi:protein ripply1 [Rhinatrema bivittatum]|uniref:protein ripply1 n=1 Tax=Rhinatrema bivittatum TaxID=194408 RepID=UPI00112E6AE5|nr:protein ripply1 [Rhinatrema bivittatum]
MGSVSDPCELLKSSAASSLALLAALQPPAIFSHWQDYAQTLHRTNPASNRSPEESNKALQLFRHPVRIFWPRSKSYDYLYNDGEKLLENFPVQATINFYEDSDSEEEEWEEEDDEEEEAEGLAKERMVEKNEPGLLQELPATCPTLLPFTCLN